MASKAYALVTSLQEHFSRKLSHTAETLSLPASFVPIDWLRNGGEYGGGLRLMAPFSPKEAGLCNRGSINVSQVHYPTALKKPLASATALSTIIHPYNPYAPSIHMHISLTERTQGESYWRLMVDLNPAIVNAEDTDMFNTSLKKVTGEFYDIGESEGRAYFYIPALERHRGISHFYLEQFNSGDAKDDFDFAHRFGQTMMDTYVAILSKQLQSHKISNVSEDAWQKQIAYHTAYFFQVLTLDRGTTAGLLVHDENDIGILASLPAYIDRELLSSYKQNLQHPQMLLLAAILECLPSNEKGRSYIDDGVKASLASSIRAFYKDYPDAVHLQAAGSITPETVANHTSAHKV
jgi:coproporphyrinogen III oxidase